MFPWGHVALAYVVYTWFTLTFEDSIPEEIPTLILGVTALLPDVFDKTLSWGLGLVPAGRATFHTLLVLIPLSALLYWVSRKRNFTVSGNAAIIGLLSHPVGDTLETLFGEPLYNTPTWLFWPVLNVPVDEDAGFHYLWEINIEPFLYFETGLTLVAFLLWYRHGIPGFGRIKHTVLRQP